MTDENNEFTEDIIQSTIRYLRTKNPDKATRENAIRLLEGMETGAHIIAHDMVENTKSRKNKNI